MKPKRPYVSKLRKSMNITPLPNYSKDGIFKIALVAPGSWGDNINQTFQLKPIKERYPNSILDVHTSDRYASAFFNNPYIDNIIEYKSHDKNSALHLIHTIPPVIQNLKYDLILARHPMVFRPWSTSKHPELGENLILVWAAQLDDLDITYQVPLESVLSLTDLEIKNVDAFLSRINNMTSKRNVLMEVQAESGQTFWNDNWTSAVCEHFLQDPNTNVYISRRDITGTIAKLNNTYEGRVYFVGGLSIRECAHLFNHCQVFQSISSGLSNACNTNWCKKDITWLEVINSPAVSSAPMRQENKHFWYTNDISQYIDYLKKIGI